MANIEDLIKIYRGENIPLNPFKERSSSIMNEQGKKLVGKYATTSAEEAAEYASRKFPNKILSTAITPDEFKTGKLDMGNYAKEKGYNILSDKNASKLKIDILKTLKSNMKALTPLAIKGLNKLVSAPAAFVVSFLDPTTANADEINMSLEDFAKLRENSGMGSMDKSIETEPRDL